MRQTQGWTEKDEKGRKIEVEAFRERNKWSFAKRAGRREEWERLETPSVADWENLVDLLERKYQRRRCAYRDVERARDFLEQAKAKEPNP